MLDRIRDAVEIDGGDEDGESPTKISEIDTEQVILDFEDLVGMDGVDVETEEAELVSEFERAVEIFEEIQPNLIHVQEEIANGEYISIIDKAINDELDQWVTENDDVIDSLARLKKRNDEIFGKVNIVDDSIGDEDINDEVDEYIEKLIHLYAIFDVESEN